MSATYENHSFSIHFDSEDKIGANEYRSCFIDEREAREICDFIKDEVSFVKPVKLNFAPYKSGLLGQIEFSRVGELATVSLFGEEEGQTVKTLLHELAHFNASGHGPDFFASLDIIISAYKNFKRVDFSAEALADTIEYLFDCADEGTKVTRLMIGTELSANDVHSNENLDYVINELRELGVTV